MNSSNSVIRHFFYRHTSVVGNITCIFSRRAHQQCILTNDKKHPTKISTLYIPGRYGADMYQIVRPVIDLDDLSRNMDALWHSCRFRDINVDLENLVDLLRRLETERNEFLTVVQKNRQYLEELKCLKSLDHAKEQYENLKMEHEEFLKQFKTLKEKLHDIEDVAFPIIQKIPNLIHPRTPLENDFTQNCVAPTESNVTFCSHTEICNKMSLLKFSQSNKFYYASGILADLELTIQNYFYKKLKDNGYAPMSCMDFCKSFLVEAVGLDPYSPDSSIPIKMDVEQGQKLHLVGGASFESFCAYLTNMNVSESTLPMRYFSLGRRYNARHKQTTTSDLFSVVQSTNFHCLTLCENPSREDEELDALFKLISSCYIDFKIPFRVVDCSPKKLNLTENCHKQLEVWSAAQQAYIPVAYISGHGNFVSKRLHVTYGVQHTVNGFCCMVEGVAVNIPVLLGCIVEHFQKSNGTFTFPDELAFLHDSLED
ncbi:serine--tRNA synthetase-like protein Slimp [Caerostris extrusa]|uniref:Serine--tRNA synthetase-like protein Slimp n=1 Tax=Caerostris extrusa TaxID=172846 RepID=A0AAV4T4Q9_CAEEX|nr:serine--tRNA synthetase-like protein Slimp [Caerostris extrusa]